MMDCMMSSAIDDLAEDGGHSVITVVDGNGPKVNEQEEHQVCPFVEREEEDVDVVGRTLQESVYRMKGMACEWCWNFPPMVRLVND